MRTHAYVRVRRVARAGASHALHTLTAQYAPRTKRILALVKRARALALLLSGTPTFSKPLSLFPLVDALARGGEDDGLNWLPARRVAERRLQFCRHFCGARRYYGGRRGAAHSDDETETS